ncbi:hypothetical protein F4808DRAFT_454929 [Astrocystis sublimbata]|nr:hypothetical protein F4808DRAFT_454929 [Astrocystis sublimbata]
MQHTAPWPPLYVFRHLVHPSAPPFPLQSLHPPPQLQYRHHNNGENGQTIQPPTHPGPLFRLRQLHRADHDTPQGQRRQYAECDALLMGVAVLGVNDYFVLRGHGNELWAWFRIVFSIAFASTGYFGWTQG